MATALREGFLRRGKAIVVTDAEIFDAEIQRRRLKSSHTRRRRAPMGLILRFDDGDFVVRSSHGVVVIRFEKLRRHSRIAVTRERRGFRLVTSTAADGTNRVPRHQYAPRTRRTAKLRPRPGAHRQQQLAWGRTRRSPRRHAAQSQEVRSVLRRRAELLPFRPRAMQASHALRPTLLAARI
jgi:transcription-repair coupling factor (superfamily II helicase)